MQFETFREILKDEVFLYQCCTELQTSVELEVNMITLSLLGEKHQLRLLKHCYNPWAFAPFGSDAVPEGPSIGCELRCKACWVATEVSLRRNS